MKMNNINPIVRESVVANVKAAEFNRRVEEAINNPLADSYNTIQILKKNKDIVIDLSNTANIVRALARLGYVAGSMVGIITNLIEISSVLMSNDFNKQFLKADGSVDMWLLRKVFPTLGKRASAEGYEVLFSEELHNVVLVENKQGRIMRLIRATKADIQTFVNQLEMAKSLTQEDLVNIGKDLERIGRVMQELEIDSAKDATVKEGMLEITEFMSAYTCHLASKKVVVNDNFNEIVAAKESGKTINDLSLTIGDYTPVEDVYKIAQAEFEAFKAAHPEMTKEELGRKKYGIVTKERNDAYIEDPAMLVKKHMIVNQEAHLNQIVELYKMSDMSLFKEFQAVHVDADKAVIEKIQRMTVVAIEMINSHFAYRKDIAMDKVDTVAAKLRNAIYTEGTKLGLEPEDTFEIAMSAGWLYRDSKNKLSPVASEYKFKYAAIAAMFETELKWHFNADVMFESIDVELPFGYALDLNTPIFMEDGECEVELDNGDVDYIICTKEEDFTGSVMAKLNEDGEVIFVKDVNEFEYEEVEFIFFDEVADMTLETNQCLHNALSQEEYEVNFIASTTAVREESTLNKTAAEAELIKAKNVNKLTAAFDAFNKFFRLPAVVEGLNYGHQKIRNNSYLTVTNEEKSRVLGRMLTNCRTKAVKEYANIDITVTAKGALVLLG